MRYTCILLILLATLCQSHRKAGSPITNTSYYVTMDIGFSSPTFLVLKKHTNTYERSQLGYHSLEIGNWWIKHDTLFLVPQHLIEHNNQSSTITKLENYWRFIYRYIVRENGLYEEQEIATPVTLLPQSQRVADPLSEFPTYFKINPKAKGKLWKQLKKSNNKYSHEDNPL